VKTKAPLFRSVIGLAAAMLGASALHAAPTLDLHFPAPSEATGSQREAMTSFRMAVGPFGADGIPTTLAEGALDQSAYRLQTADLSTLELLQSLRAQIKRAGFEVLFECETEGCGGYDFRYGTALLPEPDMHVDLGDFRYLAAKRVGPHGDEYVSLVVSRSQDNGFVQVTQVGQLAQPAPRFTASTKTPLAAPADQQALSLPAKPATADLAGLLGQGQPQVLEDLVFPSGSAELAEGDYASLQALADWLKANPSQSVTLVGHTDNDGSLEGNIAVSRKRAASVRQTLLTRYDIPADQVQAEGVGYLAPRDSNLTDEGRQKNRRVEVMLTSTQSSHLLPAP
jgi:OOP family OmpA-OmpF porin